ncbi:MAG: sugar transferase [Rubripirellula sp.]
MAKRIMDLLVSSLGIVILSPFLIMIAIAVRVTSPGPVLFRQTRVGRNLEAFQILKYRTMVVDAEKLGLQITAGADPRITWVGRILRKSKLDELPQLFNVLKGEMSLVGPRPEVPKYVEMFRDEFQRILVVRPGVTDLASIKYRDESEILSEAEDPEQAYIDQVLPDKLKLSEEYALHSSIALDFWILWKTFLRILS